jgi:hypothetical protein
MDDVKRRKTFPYWDSNSDTSAVQAHSQSLSLLHSRPLDIDIVGFKSKF